MIPPYHAHMRLYADNISALHAWRHDRNIRSCVANKSQAVAFHKLPQCAHEIHEAPLTLCNLGEPPIHLACGSALERVGRSLNVYHTYAEPLPRGMFCRVSDGLYVASPEQCFLEAACYLSRMQLVQLGMELCGSYSVALDEPGGFTKWKDATPLTTPQRLKGYIERQAGRKGFRMASGALKYIKEGAASPAEARLYMRLHMPKRYNAYGLKQNCALNPQFEFNTELARKLRRASISPDIYYPNNGVVVEYDSRMYHSGLEKIESDSRRRNLLLGFGIQVFTVTAGIMADPREFDRFVFELCGALGVKHEQLSYDELREHAKLVTELNATSTLDGALRLEISDQKAASWALPAIDRKILRAVCDS